jgi:hypothetical protein
MAVFCLWNSLVSHCFAWSPGAGETFMPGKGASMKVASMLVWSAMAATASAELPVITVQPLEVKVAAGFPAVFSVVASGGGTLRYQWRKNGVALAGATSATYRIAVADKSDENYGGTAGYDVVVTGDGGSVTSTRAWLTVVEGGAYIIENPSGGSVKAGLPYTLRVTTAETEVSYQWRRNGVAIAGGTGASYLLSAVGTVNAGRYDVVLRNSFGEVYSTPAYVGVATKVVPNLQKATYDWTTLAGSGLPGSANGPGLTAQFNNPSSIAVDGLGNIYVSDTDNHAIRKVTQAGVVTTVAGSLGAQGQGSVDGSALSTARLDSPQGIAVDKAGAVYIAEPNNNTVRKLTNPGLSSASVSTVAGVAGQFGVAGGLNSPWKVALDPSGGLYVLDNSSIRKVVSKTQFTVLFGELPEAYTGTQPGPMAMAVDSSGNIFAAANDGGEFKIFSRLTTGTFAATKYGPYPFPITDLALGAGSNLYAATESTVELLGDVSLSTPATGLPVNLTAAVDAYAAPRAVTVDAEGTVYAVDPFLNTVIKGTPSGLPVFLSHPVGGTGTNGVPLTLRAIAVGPGTLSYQWYRDGVAISGATGVTYTMASGASGGGVYTVEASNTSGTVTSGTATVVGSAPTTLTISRQPPAVTTVLSGESVELSVGWSGPASTTFQWYRNGVALSGATSATCSFSVVNAANAGDYRVELKSGTLGAVSSTARLTVRVPAAIFTQPKSVAVAADSTVNLKVSATGTPPLNYQWYKNGALIEGGTAAEYAITKAGLTDAGTYSVEVNNETGQAVRSEAAEVSILTPPSFAAQPPETAAVNLGSSATMSVTVAGSPTLSYQWRKDGVPVIGGTSEILRFPVVGESDGGSYDVLVSNPLGSVLSRPSRLSVNLPAKIVSQPPALISATIGARVLLQVVAEGTGPFTYQWFKNGVALAGETSASYLAPTLAEVSSEYYVKVASFGFTELVQSKVTTLKVLPGRGISVLRTPGPEMSMIKGTAANLKLSVDPNPPDAVRTTYRLFSYTTNPLGVDAGIGGIVPAGGAFEVPLRSLTAGGSYGVVFSREYTDGVVISSGKTAPIAVTLKTLEDSAGTYELLLTDSNGLVGDGATYRGVVLATVSKTGSVSGRVFYNEAAPLSEAPGSERTYTAVVRSFSSAFTPSAADPSKLVCTPKLGLGTQANRQTLELELDFSATVVELNAEVRDRISAAPEEDADGDGCVSRGFGAVRSATKLANVVVNSDGKSKDLNLSSLVGRYAVGSDSGSMHGSGPGVDNNATILAQILSTGKVLWATRLSGFTGSGSATLSTSDGDTMTAQFYQGRTLSTSTALSTISLTGQLYFRRVTAGTLWSAGVAAASLDGKLERQSCHITKPDKVPRYSEEKFGPGSAGSPSFNWSGVQLLDFQSGTSCRWTGSTPAGLLTFFNPPSDTPSQSMPLLQLTAEDPAEEGTYTWIITVSNTGTVRASNVDTTGEQPTLTLRLDKTRGEWVGSYVSRATKIRRTVAGVLARPPDGNSLRGAGWVEMGALPATQTSGWKLELFAP